MKRASSKPPREKLTKNESGSPTADWPFSFFTQRAWRTIGAGALALAAVMAWYGVVTVDRNDPWWFIIGYWSVFLLALVVALYMALIDFRYIRLLYLLEERQIFENTLGSEDFGKTLRRSRESQSNNGNGQQN